MEPATVGGSSLVTGGGRHWSSLPEELLVVVLQAMHVAEAVRCGAVCTSWNAADALPHCTAALHCAATGAPLRVPFPRAPLSRRPLLGAGHGWLVTADEASDRHLLNPVTGAQVAVPPITTIHHVMSGTDEQDDPAYLVYEDLPEFDYAQHQFYVDAEATVLDPLHRAYEYMFYRVVLSASPSAGPACVVLLLHMPQGEVSFVRLGDDRWTWAAPGADTGLPSRYGYRDALYSAADGLFYVVWYDASMCSLDLNGPSPVACKILNSVLNSTPPNKCLVQTPAGDILQVWRLRDYIDSPTPADPYMELRTLDLQLYKVDLDKQRVQLIESLPDYALFLGFNGSMCLPVKDFPGLKPSYVYVADDSGEYVNIY
ncbi:hypothetical protein BS78_05G189000 [Paspalum vaginatum]|nr:hypothetical protein BS78_05G189000 [Paspalum vaginatum]